MGLYPCTCSKCNAPFTWFSGGNNPAQLCDQCFVPGDTPWTPSIQATITTTHISDPADDDSVVVRIKPIEYAHEVVLYVPVFQMNFEKDGKPCFSPTFTYSMEYATCDEQMAASFNPDYILELRGNFKATTRPFTVGGDSGSN